MEPLQRLRPAPSKFLATEAMTGVQNTQKMSYTNSPASRITPTCTCARRAARMCVGERHGTSRQQEAGHASGRGTALCVCGVRRVELLSAPSPG